ncbi:MAG: hypothetical protein GXN94_00845 [Aquificae bacterium]|nr:hypothetical protein [Aquificota bacterium]
MNEKLFHLRRFYFSFLFGSFIYLAILLLVIGKDTKPAEITVVDRLLLGITGIAPAYIFLLKSRKKLFKAENYIKALLIGELPLLVGTVLSIWKGNYIYFFLAYPIFLITALLLLPTKKSVENAGGMD